MWQGKVGEDFPLESSWDNSAQRRGKRRERKKKEWKRKKKEKRSEKLHLLSRIYEDWIVGFLRSKRQNSSMQRELRVGIRIRGFRQTLRGKGFSHTLVTFGLRAI